MEEEEEVEEEEEKEKEDECNWSLASLIKVSRLSLLLPHSVKSPATPLATFPSASGVKGITGMPLSTAALTSSSSSSLLLDLLDLSMLIIPAREMVSVLEGRVGVDAGEQEDAATEETIELELLLSSPPLSSQEEEEDEEEEKRAEALTGGFLLLVTLPALLICRSSLASIDTNCWKET